MKKLIYIIPGFLSNSKIFFNLTRETDNFFDLIVRNTYSIIKKNTSIKDLVLFVEKDLKALSKKYNDIYIISHSAGSELVLRSNLNKNVKHLILWSPSMFFPQNITSTLKPTDQDKDILNLTPTIKLGRRLSKELDKLDTKKLIKKIAISYSVYLSKEDSGQDIWPKYNIIPYGHNYSKQEMKEMLKLAKEEILKEK